MSSEVQALRTKLFHQQELLEEIESEILEFGGDEGYHSYVNCDGDVVEVPLYDKPCRDAHIRCWHEHCRTLLHIESLRCREEYISHQISSLRKQLLIALVKQAAKKAKEY